MGALPAYAEARALDIESQLLAFDLEFIGDAEIRRPEGRGYFIEYRAGFPGTPVALDVYEEVVERRDDPRVKYSYHLWDQETERCLWRWDRDPAGAPTRWWA